jgi:hypothetical protein
MLKRHALLLRSYLISNPLPELPPWLTMAPSPKPYGRYAQAETVKLAFVWIAGVALLT